MANDLNPNHGIFFSFTAGDAEFFVLDTRYHRNNMTDEDNASKSMLDRNGESGQIQWLLDGLKNSPSKWKFIVSSVTANIVARSTAEDNWNGYKTERDMIMQAIHDDLAYPNLKNEIIMLSADIHTGGGIDNGCFNGFGIPELSIPHTNSFGNNNNIGEWSEGVFSGVEGAVVNGVAGGPGYAQITVHHNRVTMHIHGADGSTRLTTIKEDGVDFITDGCVPGTGLTIWLPAG